MRQTLSPFCSISEGEVKIVHGLGRVSRTEIRLSLAETSLPLSLLSTSAISSWTKMVSARRLLPLLDGGGGQSVNQRWVDI